MDNIKCSCTAHSTRNAFLNAIKLQVKYDCTKVNCVQIYYYTVCILYNDIFTIVEMAKAGLAWFPSANKRNVKNYYLIFVSENNKQRIIQFTEYSAMDKNEKSSVTQKFFAQDKSLRIVNSPPPSFKYNYVYSEKTVLQRGLLAARVTVTALPEYIL